MKKLTPVILAVALALSVLGVLGTRIYQAAAYGGAAPEILFDSEVISVPTGADDAVLLAGVTATDAEDATSRRRWSSRAFPAATTTARCASPTRPLTRTTM